MKILRVILLITIFLNGQVKPDILETIGDWFGRISNIGESVMNAVSLYKTFNSENGSKLVKDSFNSGNFLANVALQQLDDYVSEIRDNITKETKDISPVPERKSTTRKTKKPARSTTKKTTTPENPFTIKIPK